jgi:transcriptional regulator with XRE-family HTH domain
MVQSVEVLRVQKIDVPNLGAKIKAARKADSRTLSTIAAAAGMSAQNWYRIEDERQTLPEDTLRLIEQVLGVDFGVSFIVRDEPLNELVDILHFLLTAIELEKLEGDYFSWERDLLDLYWAEWAGAVLFEEDKGWCKNLVKLQVCILEGRIGVALLRYIKACSLLGFTREQVEKAFLEKAKVNHDRMIEAGSSKTA